MKFGLKITQARKLGSILQLFYNSNDIINMNSNEDDYLTYGEYTRVICEQYHKTGSLTKLHEDKKLNLNYAFLYSCRFGYTAVVEQLLPFVDPSMEENFAISTASINNHPQVVYC